MAANDTWDPDYPEYAEWQGVVTIEVPIAVRSMSGRSKHTDPEEQGTWIAEGITVHLRETFKDADDVKTGEARLVSNREERWTDWT
jgi:hypothetical protein